MKKVLIAAHYNLNNGDRAVLEGTIQQLLQYNSDCEIYVSAYDPTLLKDSRFKTIPWPLKKNKILNKLYILLCKIGMFKISFLFKSLFFNKAYLEVLKQMDIVLISGGHHLTDIIGVGTFYKLAQNFLIPIILKKDIFLLPQSIGPVKNKQVQRDIKYILERVNYIAYRDYSSKEFLNSLDIDTSHEYIPDIVYSIKPEQSTKKNKRIGISLYCNYSGEKREKLMPFVHENITKVINYFAMNGYSIDFIPMEVKDSQFDDRKYAKLIINRVQERYQSQVAIVEPASDSILDTINLFSGYEIILAYKTHSVVFSTICRTPVVAIAYHPKSVEFMKSIGLDKYAIMDTDADGDALIKLMEKILMESNEVRYSEDTGVAHNVALIEQLCGRIFIE